MMRADEVLPSFSIVIPTYNRPGKIAACLESLTALDYPSRLWEVIVVDDGSPEPLDDIVAPYQERLPLILLRQENTGPAQARNIGAAHAGGAYLVFTDDDCAPAPGWLRALAIAAAKTPDAGIGGRTLNALPHDACAAASQLLIAYLYDYYNRPDTGGESGGARFFASNNLAFPTAGFREIGGFDIRFRRAAAEDRALCDRWLAEGRCLRYAPDAVIQHRHDMRLRDYWRQHRHYGAGAYHFHRLRAAGNGQGVTVGRDGSSRPKLEPSSFYIGLLTYAFRYTPPDSPKRSLGWRLRLSALMGLSQVATAAGYFTERAREAQCTASGAPVEKGVGEGTAA